MVWQLGSEVLNSYCNIIVINKLIFLIEVNLSLINHTFMEKFIYYIKKRRNLVYQSAFFKLATRWHYNVMISSSRAAPL